MESKKQKYAEYYRTGKLNIINFINGLNTNDNQKLIKMYAEMLKEEKGLEIELEVKKRKQFNTKKSEDVQFDIEWIERKLEFIRTKKEILQKAIDDNEIEK